MNPVPPEELFVGLYYGALAALVLANLTLLVSLRERAYLYFSLFLASLALSTFAWDGYAELWLWPDSPEWGRASPAIFDAATAFFAVQFARTYLETRRTTPRLDRALRACMLLAIAVVPLTLRGTFEWSLLLVSALTLGGPCLLLAAGIQCLRRGEPAAKHYLAAQSLLFFGLVVELTGIVAGAEPDGWTDAVAYAGIVLVGILFFLGLAERFKLAVRERERVAAENRALFLHSYRDGLTEIWNRRRFDEHLGEEWKRCAREGTPLALALADVDFFKPYNDRYGHQAGDDCLRRVGRALEAGVHRPGDIAARYGGEEFAVVLSGIEGDDALAVAETLRASVESLEIPHEASEAAERVTISVGVASLVPDADRDLKELVEAADTALYAAKEAGRNRVVGSLEGDG